MAGTLSGKNALVTGGDSGIGAAIRWRWPRPERMLPSFFTATRGGRRGRQAD